VDVQNKYGQRWYKVDDAIAQILIAEGILTPFNKAQPAATPAAPKEPLWTVGNVGLATGDIKLCIQCTMPSGEVTNPFTGTPQEAKKYPWPAPIPAEILQTYTLLYGPIGRDAQVAEANKRQLAEARDAQSKHDAPGARRY